MSFRAQDAAFENRLPVSPCLPEELWAPQTAGMRRHPSIPRSARPARAGRGWTAFLAAGALLLGAPGVPTLGAQEPYVVVLGVAQDAGHPQMGCRGACCAAAAEDPRRGHLVASLGLVDPRHDARYLFDATPDLPRQLHRLDRDHPVPREGRDPGLDGIFLTHAHIGHYTGLMHLGREAMGTAGVPVYAMPRMAGFLEANGPWSQLVTLGNIELRPLADAEPVRLADALQVTPLRVPHRDEFSETVGFVIEGPRARVLFLPDIDKWDRWERDLEAVVRSVDRAYVDGSFFENGEIPGRDMRDIPHPFIAETLSRVAAWSAQERAKIRFLHLNHTNPALDRGSPATATIEAAGCAVAVEGETFGL